MGMTIKDIKNEIRSDRTTKRMTGDDYSESLRDCIAQLLVIAEKYQKIERILNWREYDVDSNYHTNEDMINEIREVLEDGNN